VDPFIVITSILFPVYHILAFAGTRSSTKFKYSFDFPSAFRYFARVFLITIWEVVQVVFDIRFELIDVESIVDKRKSTVR